VQWPAQQQQQQQCSPGATTHHPNSADASHVADTQQHVAQPAASTPTSTTTPVPFGGVPTNSPHHLLISQRPYGRRGLAQGVAKKLVIAQCTNREKVLFATHQLYGTAANWWETYCNTHANADTITWNEFKSRFRTHYVPRGTMKLKRKEFANLKQGGRTVNEYLNSFIQLSRYAPDDINTDKKKQDVFLSGLNDDIQFQLLNTDYADFQHMVNKAIIIENKIQEMEKDGKRKVPFSGQSSGSNVRPRFTQPNQFYKPLQMNRPPMLVQVPRSQFLTQRPNFQAQCPRFQTLRPQQQPP
jgi:hypothetical protein